MQTEWFPQDLNQGPLTHQPRDPVCQASLCVAAWAAILYPFRMCAWWRNRTYEGCSKSLWPDHEREEIQSHSMCENTTSQSKNIHQEKGFQNPFAFLARHLEVACGLQTMKNWNVIIFNHALTSQSGGTGFHLQKVDQGMHRKSLWYVLKRLMMSWEVFLRGASQVWYCTHAFSKQPLNEFDSLPKNDPKQFLAQF